MSVLRQLVKRATRVIPLPLMAVLECTKVCNLKCPYCRRWSDDSCARKNKDELHMTPEKLAYILNRIPTLRQVDWMGEGEPLCNPYFNELIELTHKRRITTGFSTNGTLVTLEDVKFWKSRGVNRIGVSLDSPIAEEYEKMRPGAKFSRVIESCRLISGAGLNLQMNLVLFQENVKNLRSYLKLCKELCAKRIDLCRPQLYVGIQSEYHDLEDTEENRRKIQDAVEEFKFDYAPPVLPGPWFRKCAWPFVAPYINIQGDIYSCCYATDTPEGRNEYMMGEVFHVPCRNYLMGNIFNGHFWYTWFGPGYAELRSTIKKSDRPEGAKVALVEARSMLGKERFDYCRYCGWRLGVEC